MKAKVSTTTDSTNVWGYIDVIAIRADGTQLSHDEWLDNLPSDVQAACSVQYTSERHIPTSALTEVENMLREYGWEII